MTRPGDNHDLAKRHPVLLVEELPDKQIFIRNHPLNGRNNNLIFQRYLQSWSYHVLQECARDGKHDHVGIHDHPIQIIRKRDPVYIKIDTT